VRIQLRSRVGRARPQYFILTVDPTEDVPPLNERDHLPLRIFDCPSKRGAHTLQPDRRERLEIEYDGAGAYERDEGPDVCTEQWIEQKTGLIGGDVLALFWCERGGKGLTENLERSSSTARKLLAIQASKSSFMPSPSPATPSLSTTLVLSSARPNVASEQSVAYTPTSPIEMMLPAHGASAAADMGCRKSCAAFA
jgi:hypothetical protein